MNDTIFDSFIGSFIPGKAFIFMFICSYVLIHILIHPLQLKFLSLCLFVLMYWLIYYRHSFYLYNYLFSFIFSFTVSKTMENLRNQHTVELVASEEKLKKLTAQPSFKHFKIFHETWWLWNELKSS